MPYLLDTPALSELIKPRPNASFMDWLEAQSNEEVFIGAPTIGEIESGILSMPSSAKKRNVERWFDDLLKTYASRLLPLDLAACRAWGRAVGAARLQGRTLPIVDSQLAAIAHTRRLTVVTRNVRHFSIDDFPGLELVNPWK